MTRLTRAPVRLAAGSALCALPLLAACTGSSHGSGSSARSGSGAAVGLGRNVVVTRTAMDHVEPDIAINPMRTANVLGACQYEPASRTRLPGTFVSFDGGRTWTDNGLLPRPRGYDQGADTTVAFDREGTGYVVALFSAGGGGYASRVRQGGIFLWRTRDGGRTFARPVAVYIGRGFQDHPWFAVREAGRRTQVLVTWTNAGGLQFATSNDSGSTFTSPRELVAGAAANDPVLTVSGTVVRIFYEEFSGQVIRLHAVTSSDGGGHFTPPTTVGTVVAPPLGGAGPKGGNQPPPLLAAASGAAGSAGVAIAGQLGGHPTIQLWRSTAAGSGWAGPIEPITGGDATLAQTQPRLEFDGPRVYLTYFSTTRTGQITANLAEGRNDRRLVVTKLSSAPFISAGFIGDYQGLAVAGHLGYAVWNDSRPGRLQIAGAAFVP